jgi:hypothetical protein
MNKIEKKSWVILVLGVFLLSIFFIGFVSAQVTCIDSDGDDPYVKGTATGWRSFDDDYSVSKTDFCYVQGTEVDENLISCLGKDCGIQEFSCITGGDSSNEFVGGTFYSCSEGCQNGVCLGIATRESSEGFGVASLKITSCVDTDGKDYYSRGSVTWTTVAESTGEDFTNTEIDGCVNNTLLAEHFCNLEEGLKEIDYYSCPNGCSYGACISDEEKNREIILKINGKEQPDSVIFLSEFNLSWNAIGDFEFCTIGGSKVYLNNKKDTLDGIRIGTKKGKGYDIYQHPPLQSSGQISLIAAVATGTDYNSVGFQENITMGIQCWTSPDSEGVILPFSSYISVQVKENNRVEINPTEISCNNAGVCDSESSSSTCNLKGECIIYPKEGVNARGHFVFINSLDVFSGITLNIDGEITPLLNETNREYVLEDGSVLSIHTLSKDYFKFNFIPSCSGGCFEGDLCYDVGTIKGNRFCDSSSIFVTQLEKGKVCEWDYQCLSNECSDNNSCTSPSFSQKIAIFFNDLFS